MSIHLPNQCGIIIRKSPRTLEVVVAMRRWNPRLPRNEDQHLAGFWLAGSSAEAGRHFEELVREYRLQDRVDLVPTQSNDGVIGPMPDWLQENEEPEYTFSVPGTAGPARATARPTWHEQFALERRARRVARVASRREGEAAAYRRWPELHDGDVTALLGESWALVEFIEGSMCGGPARSWVEKAFPAKTWHIPIEGGYSNELRDGLKAYYQDGGTRASLARLRRRAGEYIVALESGPRRRTVDLACFEAWKRTHLTQDFLDRKLKDAAEGDD
jgi:hypothetical protein